MDLPAFDNHFHLDPDGRGLEAVKEFIAAGGSGINLVQKQYASIPFTNLDQFELAMSWTCKQAKIIRSELDLPVAVSVAPHPDEILPLIERLGISRAKELLIAALDLAAEHVRSGEAHALGEIGRPHFPLDQSVMEASEEIFDHALTLVEELGCVGIVHTEPFTESSYRTLRRRLKNLGVSERGIVKHYAPPITDPDVIGDIIASIVATKKDALAAAQSRFDFLMETDFLDDRHRPGAVLGPRTIPRRTRFLFQQGLLEDDQLHRIHQEIPASLYELDLG